MDSKTDNENKGAAQSLPSQNGSAFIFRDLTHYGKIKLSTGSELTISKGPSGWFFAGENGEYEKSIAFTDEAVDFIVSAVLRHREEKPIPHIELHPQNT